MNEEMYVGKWDDLEAGTVFEHLERFVDKLGLQRYLRLNTTVLKVEKLETKNGEGDGWRVEVQEGGKEGGA
jgi:hypothetical protein